MREQIEWIPTAERLPGSSAPVLICNPHARQRVWVGYTANGVDWYDTEGDRIDVSHWAALPAGPTPPECFVRDEQRPGLAL